MKSDDKILLLYVSIFCAEKRDNESLYKGIYVIRSSTWLVFRRIKDMWNEIKLERKPIHRGGKIDENVFRRNLSFADIIRYFDRDEIRDKWRSTLQFHYLLYIYIYFISFETVRNLSGAFIHDIADRKD